MDEKTMLGIAYILMLVPIVNIIGFILMIIGWMNLGNRYKEETWKWVGYSAILAIIAAIVIAGSLFTLILSGGIGSIGGAFGSILVGGISVIAAIVLLLIFWILQIIGLWNAGKKFNSTLLQVSGILLIIPVLGEILAGIGFLTLKE